MPRCSAFSISLHSSFNLQYSIMALTTMAPKNTTIPPIQRAYPSINPLDHYRVAIARELSRIEPAINVQLAYDSLDRTRDLAYGDLVLALPRLRLQCDPAKLGQKLASEVRFSRFPVALSPGIDSTQNLSCARIPFVIRSINESLSCRRSSFATTSTPLSTLLLTHYSNSIRLTYRFTVQRH